MDEFLEKETVQLLEWIAQFGNDAKDGVTRLVYTSDWKNAQQALHGKMQDIGLLSWFDTVGNLFGRLQGTDATAGVIMTGSHVDTVKNGGKYDGAYGIVAGLVALRYLGETYGPPLRSIEVVSLCEEEGSRFPLTFWGSGAIVGKHFCHDFAAMRDQEGIYFYDAMREAGYDPTLQSLSARDDIDMFLELHVEQGCVLEHHNKSVGIVQRIVGQRRMEVRLRGEANHAGTTPMHWRKDALHCATEMIQLLLDEASTHSTPLVATVGRMEISPNVSNVIPGHVSFTVDIRHPVMSDIDRFSSQMMERFAEIAARRDIAFSYEIWMDTSPVQMDQALIGLLERTCQTMHVSYQMMDSGAGHDAQIFANQCPTGLLFVPSRNGVSHSPQEYTEPAQLLAGIQVLISMLYQLAYVEVAEYESV